MSADLLLASLHKVKRTGPESWIACCPSHPDKNPSLAIRDTDDGRVLVHCFGGCPVDEILETLGLDMADLFPERQPSQHSSKPLRNRFSGRDVLECVANEALIVGIVAAAIADARTVPAADLDRCRLATLRIQEAINAIG